MGFSISKSVISCWDVTINTFADLPNPWGAIIVCRDFIAMDSPARPTIANVIWEE